MVAQYIHFTLIVLHNMGSATSDPSLSAPQEASWDHLKKTSHDVCPCLVLRGDLSASVADSGVDALLMVPDRRGTSLLLTEAARFVGWSIYKKSENNAVASLRMVLLAWLWCQVNSGSGVVHDFMDGWTAVFVLPAVVEEYDASATCGGRNWHDTAHFDSLTVRTLML